MELWPIVDQAAPDQEPEEAEGPEEIEDGGPAQSLTQPAAHWQGHHSPGCSPTERECRESGNYYLGMCKKVE